MNKKVFIALLLGSIWLTADNRRVLPEVLQPEILVMGKNRIYVGDREKVWLYSRKDNKLIKTFGKKGEGPGEYKFRPDFKIHNQVFLFEDVSKYMVYSLDGKYLREARTPPGVSGIFLLDKAILGMRRKAGGQTGEFIFQVVLFDSSFKIQKILESEREIIFNRSGSSKPKISLVRHCFEARVYRNRLYIGNTYRGMCVNVYDRKGKRLNGINRKFKYRPAGKALLEAFIRERKKQNDWERIKNTFAFEAPDYYTAFRYFRVSDDRIYLVGHADTYGGRTHVITILDLAGKLLGTRQVRLDRPWCIFEGKVYSLVENDDEEFELNVQPLIN